jgi:hypothetical protein
VKEYLAGFVDGEGCISIIRYGAGRVHYLRLSVTQLDRRPLDLLRQEYGGSVYRKVRPGRRDIFEWVVADSTALSALEDLLPHLIVKRDQAVLGIEFQRKKGTRPRRTPLTDVELVERDQAYLDMRALKAA